MRLAVSTDAISDAAGLMAESRPAVLEAIHRLNTNLETSEALLMDIQPRIGPLYDSLTATLGDTRQLLQQLQASLPSARPVAIPANA